MSTSARPNNIQSPRSALMSAHRQPAAMTRDEFRTLLDASGLTQAGTAEALGVNRATVLRWLDGYTPISAGKATLVRERIRPDDGK